MLSIKLYLSCYISGEQLLVSPSGYGVCGCIQNPVHVTSALDDQCYPLYHRGPCQPGFIITWSPMSGEATCSPALCGEGSILWEVGTHRVKEVHIKLQNHLIIICQDGECYELDDQGPCQAGQYLTVSSDTMEPICYAPKVVSFLKNAVSND